MADHPTSFSRSFHPRLEALESREVPTSFGAFRGLSVAFADVMGGDSQNEFITGTGPGREALVRIWSSDGVERMRFDPFPGSTAGVYVTTGDVDNDGGIELICSTAPGTTGQVKVYAFRSGGPQIKVFDAQTPTIITRSSYMAYDIGNPANRQGINVAAGSTDGRRGAEVYAGLRNAGTIRIFNGWSGGFLKQIRPYPTNYSRTVNFFVNTTDDDINGIYTVGNLVTVGANGPFEQIPIIFPGQLDSPAGLNGSFPAA